MTKTALVKMRRAIKRGSTVIYAVGVCKRFNRRNVYLCMAMPEGDYVCGACGIGRVKPLLEFRCECGAVVRLVDKRIDYREALRVEEDFRRAEMEKERGRGER